MRRFAAGCAAANARARAASSLLNGPATSQHLRVRKHTKPATQERCPHSSHLSSPIDAACGQALLAGSAAIHPLTSHSLPEGDR